MKHFWTFTIPCAVLLALAPVAAWSQNAPKLNARELFYSPPPSTGTATSTATSAATGKAATTAAAGKSGAAASTSVTATTGAGKSGATASSGGRSGGVTTSTGKTPTVTASTSTPSTSSTSTATASASNTSSPATSTNGTSTKDTSKDNPTIVAAVGQGGNLVNTSSSNLSASSGPLGLRYAVLKRESGSAFREVDPETKFRTGDSIRLNVTPSTSGYLYVVQQGASGIWTLLFPRPEVAGGSNFVERGQMLAVPSDKAMWTFDAHAGEEKLFIVLARKPEPDLDKLIYSIDRAGDRPGDPASSQKLVAQAKVRDDVVNHLRDQMVSRDLVFEKVDESTSDSTGKAENAAYVVSQNPSPDARLVKDLTLSHQ